MTSTCLSISHWIQLGANVYKIITSRFTNRREKNNYNYYTTNRDLRLLSKRSLLGALLYPEEPVGALLYPEEPVGALLYLYRQ